ncbi:hypothetical protein BV25DRAFT_1555794 [Artomyces pyxidatus]|uniref:Uncharacterized protein n=1 Tax=Artomyces pyxidatus TaxID=48021 RepID=A0ACB8SL62_9AGAM|nr:hypothetical protein BV25DRAFT_1555794 [Artomyces pyxidatus]
MVDDLLFTTNVSAMHSFILLFPDEILLGILENLDYKAVIACQLTCRKLRSVTASVSLQYKLELAACGMLDGTRGQQVLDTPERLERLRRYDTAWRELEWTGSVRLSHLIGQWFTIKTGPLVFCLHGADFPHLIQAVPSKLRGTHEVHHTFQPAPRDLVKVDSSQDLVIYLKDEFEDTWYHIKSLSTGEPHPLAANLGIIPLSDSQAYSSILDIRGDYLLEMGQFASPTGHFIVRNWKTGSTEMQKEMDLPDRPRCCFLDDKHVIFYVNTAFYHRSDDLSTKSFRILPFRRSEGSMTGTVLDAAVQFLLPPFMFSNDFLATTEVSAPGTGPQPSTYFYSNPDDRLFSTSVVYAMGAFAQFTDQYVLDIPFQTFTAYMRDHPTTGPNVVPWDAWGPHGTRVTWNGADDSRLGTSICGMRRCHYRRSDEGVVLTVLDYHPRRVARASARRQDGDGLTIERGAHIGSDHTGHDPVSTTLPCLVTERLLPDAVGPGRIVLCEDGFVFVKHDEVAGLVSDIWAYTI